MCAISYRSTALPQMDEQHAIFDTLSWPSDTGPTSSEKSQTSTVAQSSSSATELPSLLTILMPMMNGNESTPGALLPSQSKQSAVMFSSNNGVIDDPLIQSLAAEQAASAHNYDLLSHRHKRVDNRWK